MNRAWIWSILSIILLSAFVIAGVSYSGENLVKTYSGGQTIRGTLNLTFNNVPADALVESNFEGNLTLLELLDGNGFSNSIEFNCSTANCLEDYSTGDSTNYLNLSEENILAFAVQGNPFNEIEDIKLSVESNAQESCFPQLKIDFLNDGDYIVSGQEYSDETCFSTKMGCFETGLSSSSYQRATVPRNGLYCERMLLPAGPAYKLGAKINNSNGDNADLKMSLRKLNGDSLGSCILPKNVQETEELECIVEYSNTEQKEFYVCINALANSDYGINVEFNNPCGTSNPGSAETADYEVFAKNLKYASPDILVNSTNFQASTGKNLNDYVNNYIAEKYNNICNPECIIPLKFIGASQEIDFSNVLVKYRSGGASGLQNNNLYLTSIESPKISSGKLAVDMEPAGFYIPFGSKEKKFKLYIDDDSIAEIAINLSGSFDFDVTPKFSPFGRETNFQITGLSNVSSSDWNFGDGTKDRVSGKSASHIYTTQGEFEIEVRATTANGESSIKNFTILVGNPEQSANQTLEEYSQRVNSVKNELLNYSSWLQSKIKAEIKLDSIESSLTNLKLRYDQSTTEEQYEEIMLLLVELDVPESISSASLGKIPLATGIENADVDYIQQISGVDVENTEELRNRIGSWMYDNYNAEIEFENIEANYPGQNEEILSYFKIKTNPKQDPGAAYLIIDYSLDQIEFDKAYGAQEVSGATYIPLVGGIREVSFVIYDSVGPQELGAYISPSLNDLGDYRPVLACDYDRRCEKSLGENNSNCPTDCRPYGTAIVLIVLIVLGGIVAYLGIRMWYQKNYEKKLFKQKTDLFNILNFIKDAERKGMGNSEMRSKLKKAGWTGEQVSYALKKALRKSNG